MLQMSKIMSKIMTFCGDVFKDIQLNANCLSGSALETFGGC